MLVPALGRIAPSVGLVDRPDLRKRHEAVVPLVGGLSILGALLVATPLLGSAPAHLPVLLAIAVALAALGAVDDARGLRASYRMLAQAVLAAAMVWFADLRILQVGNLVGAGEVHLGYLFGLAFTVMCVIGVINSINMIDGVDGLSGVIVASSFAATSWLAWRSGDTASAMFCLVIVAACAGFLAYNLRLLVRRAHVFMGDAGSTFLGFVMVWFFIGLTQRENPAMSSVVAGWIFGLPLMDTVSVMVGRILARRSPFAAGRDHLHHQLLDRGVSTNATVAIIAAAHALFIAVGIAFHDSLRAQPAMFWGFVAIVVAHHFLTPHLLDALVGPLRTNAATAAPAPEDRGRDET